MENIFLEQTIKDLKNIELKINHGLMKDVEKFVIQVNQNPGYLFLLNKDDGKVYIGEIIEISCSTDEQIDDYKIEINGKIFFVKLCEGLQEFSIDVLEMIYSKNQRKNLGLKSFSLKNTYYKRNFKFARPIIHDYDFLLRNHMVDDFRNYILEDNSFFNKDNKKKIYAKFLEEDERYFFSLTNKKMIEEDFRVFEIAGENYRPYFYEFYIEKYTSLQIKELQIGEIYEVIITDTYYQAEDEENDMYIGNLLFSASPLVEIPAKLIIKSRLSDSEKQQINASETALRGILETEKTNDKDLIETNIMEKIPTKGDLEFETTIYNVGQGNWSKITASDFDGNKLDIIYDIGIGSSQNLSLTKRIARKAISDIAVNHIFILSHWDLDHIKGITNLSEPQFNTTWIVPDLPSNLSFPAIRLALYLYKHSNINVVFVSDELNNKEIFSNQYMALGKGEGKEIGTYAIRNGQSYKTSYTVNNNIGLVLCIKNTDEKILFTGDCEYIQLPIEFLNENYYAIVMAHHGAKINYNDLTEIGMLPASNDRAKAYVCVGKNNNYPNSEHKGAIENLSFTVVETRSYTDINNQIKIQLPTIVGV
ncbi:hypothetical protein [Lysinibacillus sp. LZ02]|uniref:hypothetical protein n=1 Tax=Lysinibacillus sp. LZ02 TaxID=3420668 RepID=UPI003D36636B